MARKKHPESPDSIPKNARTRKERRDLANRVEKRDHKSKRVNLLQNRNILLAGGAIAALLITLLLMNASGVFDASAQTTPTPRSPDTGENLDKEEVNARFVAQLEQLLEINKNMTREQLGQALLKKSQSTDWLPPTAQVAPIGGFFLNVDGQPSGIALDAQGEPITYAANLWRGDAANAPKVKQSKQFTNRIYPLDATVPALTESPSVLGDLDLFIFYGDLAAANVLDAHAATLARFADGFYPKKKDHPGVVHFQIMPPGQIAPLVDVGTTRVAYNLKPNNYGFFSGLRGTDNKIIRWDTVIQAGNAAEGAFTLGLTTRQELRRVLADEAAASMAHDVVGPIDTGPVHVTEAATALFGMVVALDESYDRSVFGESIGPAIDVLAKAVDDSISK